MLEFKKGHAPGSKKYSSKRNQVEQILREMEVDHYCEITIENPGAFAVMFSNMKARICPEKKFYRQKGDYEGDETFADLYTVYRIK